MKLVREYIIFEKFTEDSDPIKDMGIGIEFQKKKYKIYLLYETLYGLEPFDYKNLKKGFDLNPKKDLFYLGDAEDFIQPKEKRYYKKLKELINSGKKIFENDYYETDGHELTILRVYETDVGKIGTFSYPDYPSRDNRQFFGEIEIFLELKSYNYDIL